MNKEIDERKQAKERLKHLNVVLRAIRNVNKLITKEKDRDRLLQGACDNLVETQGYFSAWIALMDSSGKLLTTAESGLKEAFLPLVELIKRGELPVYISRALKGSEVVAIEDPSATCTVCPLVPEYDGRGSMTVRLEYSGKVYGTFSVSVPRNIVLDEEEQALFGEVADDIAFALHNMELEEKRKRSEQKLKTNKKFSSILLNNSPNPIIGINPDTSIDYVNPALERLTGFSYEELKGKKAPYPFWRKEMRKPILKDIKAAMRKGAKGLAEEFQKKNGESVWVEITSSPIIHDGKLDYYISNWVDITERKKAEEALQESEERMRAILEASPEMIFQVDTDFRIIWANKKCLDYNSKAVGSFCYKEYQDKDEVCEGCPCYKALKTNQISISVMYHLAMEGIQGESYWENIGVPLRDNQGNVIGAIEIARDVTEREQSVKALRQSEEKLAGIVDSIIDHMIMVDEHFNIVWANDVAKEFFGPDLVGMKCYSAYHRHDKACEPCIVKECFRDGKVHEFETEINTPKGEKRTVWCTASIAAWSEDNRPKMVVEFLRDITERKRAEEVLQKSEEFNKKIIESSIDCIKILDLNGRLKFMSKGGQKLLEIEDIGPYLNLSWIDFWKGSDRKAALEAISRANEGDIGHFQGYCPTEKGTEKWWDIIITPMMGKDGKVKQLLSISRDITEYRMLEAQYRQAQKMEAIGTLAGGIAHDFNNLLTAIIGNAQLALMNVIKDESLRNEIQEIKKAGDRAASLTRQLLVFSRKQIIKPEILNINKEISETEKMLKRMIRENIEFLVVLEPNLWKIHADPGHINQVIMNLVINAKDAMPSGGKLTIETANVELDDTYFQSHNIESKPGPYVMLAVTDNGTGIDEENLSRIFDPFFTTKEISRGTGLGLPTVYGIMKQNNGYVWVYSELGKGTTFKVYFPKVAGVMVKSGKEQEEFADEISGSETVLIVEDDDGLRYLVKKALQRYGYKILEADNGEKALNVSETHEGPIHLLLTDIIMPGINGTDLSEKLQSIRPEIQVIYMSGYTDNAIVHHGILRQDINFIEKPFSPEVLGKKLRQVLDKGTDD